MAAITGYQLTEVRKERIELTIEKLEKKLEATNQILDATTRRKGELDAAVIGAQNELDSTRTDFESLRSCDDGHNLAGRCHYASHADLSRR